MAPRNLAFTEDYREKCFLAWVAAGMPSHAKSILEILPEENGRRPTIHTFHAWADIYDWRGRAEEINARAIEVANTQIVNIKADILRKQYEDSVKIAAHALAHITKESFDSSASAVSAYFKATEEMRRVVGISEIIEKMTRMSDAELEREIMTRIRQATDANQFIEGEEVDDTEDSEEETP